MNVEGCLECPDCHKVYPKDVSARTVAEAETKGLFLACDECVARGIAEVTR